MDVNEIKTYLEENKDNEEVVGLIKSYEKNLTLETVMDFLANDKAGKSYLDSCCDRYSSKAIETARTNAIEKFKADELPKLLEDELRKVNNKDLTPEQIQLKELQDQIAQMQKEKILAENKLKTQKIFNENNIPVEFMDFLMGADELKTLENVQIFKTSMDAYIKSNVDNGINDRLKNSTYTPPATKSTPAEMTKEQFNKLGYSQRNELFATNQELYKKLAK